MTVAEAVEVKERPILFSGEMVRAILAGRKTQTRRVVKNPDYFGCLTGDCPHWERKLCDESMRDCCPYGKPGDRLWVRESWTDYRECTEADLEQNSKAWDAFTSGRKDIVSAAEQIATPTGTQRAMYRADFDCEVDWNWKPGIFMPRWASRLILEIEQVRVPRVQEISVQDII